MHADAFDYLRRMIGDPTDLHVLEIGSYDVNGSPRPLCAGAASYVGIDVRPGRGVDLVVSATDYEPDRAYDLVISAEVLEHAPDPVAVLACAWRALRPGGRLIVTAAALERPPHNCDGGAVIADDEHYANINPADLRAWLTAWSGVAVECHPQRGDVYAVATKPSRARTR